MTTRPSFFSTFPWLFAALALALTVLPVFVGVKAAPAGSTYVGTLINPDDLSVYLAAMRQGAEGQWLYHFQFSPETIPPRLTYSLYLLLGRLPAPADLAARFHLARVVAVVITLLALWVWVRRALPNQHLTQVTAWLLMVFGGGLGYLAVYALPNLSRWLPDLLTPEWTLTLAFLSAPHFALGVGLQALLFTCLQATENRRSAPLWAGLGAVSALALGLIYPYNISVVGLVLGIYMLTLAVQARQIPWRRWLWGGVIVAPLLPLVYYFTIIARRDPLWELTHMLNNVVPAPHLLGVLIGLGLPGLLAGLALPRWWRTQRDPLPWVWALTHLACLAVPVPFAGRFALGLFVPIATLAADGLLNVVIPVMRNRAWFNRLSATPAATVRRVAVLLSVPSSALVVLGLAQAMLVGGYPYHLPTADLTALAWLGQNTTSNSLTLAYYPAGNNLPTYGAGRVFVGQLFLTVNLDDKLTDYDQFWRTPASQQSEFLAKWGISHIFVGTFERQQQPQALPPPATPIYERDGVIIYEVRP